MPRIGPDLGGNLVPFPNFNDAGVFDGWDGTAGLSAFNINTLVAPDGNQTAAEMVEASNGTFKQLFIDPNLTKTTDTIIYTQSLFVKRLPNNDPRDLLLVNTTGGTNFVESLWNLATGALRFQDGTGHTFIDSNAVEYDDDWFRIQFSYSIGADTTMSWQMYMALLTPDAIPGAISYTGDGASAVGVWRARLFEGFEFINDDFAGSAPVLGQPAITSLHVLTADNLVTGFPDLGEPVIITSTGVAAGNFIPYVNRALQMIGTRTTVESLTEDSNEAIEANKIVNSTRQQALRAAPWSFAKRTDFLTLLKAAPGTQEYNLSLRTNLWTPLFPAPPWRYVYDYPDDCLQALAIRGQANASTYESVFGLPGQSLYNFGPQTRFEIASDVIGVQNTGNNFSDSTNSSIALAAADQGVAGSYVGERIYVNDGNGHFGWSTVQSYDVADNIVTFPTISGLTFGTNDYFYLIGVPRKVVLTNQPNALLDYIFDADQPDLWDVLFEQAYVSALAGFLAFQLSGSLQLANALINQANRHIIEARVRDGNEGLTIQDHVPDWIAVRGGQPQPPWQGLQYSYGPLFMPFGS